MKSTTSSSSSYPYSWLKLRKFLHYHKQISSQNVYLSYDSMNTLNLYSLIESNWLLVSLLIDETDLICQLPLWKCNTYTSLNHFDFDSPIDSHFLLNTSDFPFDDNYSYCIDHYYYPSFAIWFFHSLHLTFHFEWNLLHHILFDYLHWSFEYASTHNLLD